MTPAASPLWFLDRSAGEVTLVLMSAVVILGIVRSSLPTFSPFLTEGMHINLALLTVAFGGLHILTAILDSFANLGPVDALVPFVSAYRGTWLGLGVVSGYVFAAVLLSSWPVRRFGRLAWQWVHRCIYVAWGLGLVHTLGTGSDMQNYVFLALNALAAAAVLSTFIVLRAWAGPRLTLRGAAAGIAALVAVAAITVWAFNGPLQPGWARAAGTPADLLKSR